MNQKQISIKEINKHLLSLYNKSCNDWTGTYIDTFQIGVHSLVAIGFSTTNSPKKLDELCRKGILTKGKYGYSFNNIQVYRDLLYKTFPFKFLYTFKIKFILGTIIMGGIMAACTLLAPLLSLK